MEQEADERFLHSTRNLVCWRPGELVHVSLPEPTIGEADIGARYRLGLFSGQRSLNLMSQFYYAVHGAHPTPKLRSIHLLP